MKNKKPLFTEEEIRVSEIDFSEYLDSEEMIAGYLEECLEDPNPNVFLRALGDAAKAMGMTELARKTGLPRESLYKSLNGECKPQFETVMKITRAMGLDLSLKNRRVDAAEEEKHRSREAAPAKRRRKRDTVGSQEAVTA